MKELALKIRLVDEVSSAMNNIGDSGTKVIAGLEDGFVNVSSEISRTSKTAAEASASIAKLSGDVAETVTQSRLLANAAENQANKLENAAEKAREKADSDSQAASEARKFYEGLQKQLLSVDKVTEAMKDEAAQALKLSNDLDKTAQKSELKAQKAEKAAVAARNNASAVEKAALAEEKHAQELVEKVKAEEQAAEVLEKVNQEHAEVTNTVEKNIRTEEKLVDLIDEKSRAEQQVIQALDETANGHNKTTAAIEKNVQAEEKLQASASQTVNTEQKVADSLNKSEQEAKEYGDAMIKAADDSEKLGDKGGNAISELESIIAGAGIVMGLKKIGEAFLDCSNSAAQFESNIAKVSTIADTSQVSLSTIESDIMALSRSTGQGAGDLTEATYQAISASVDTAYAVKFVDEANKLAVGGFTQQATAADVLTTAINAYGLAVSEATQVSDMLITTQNLGKTTVDELAQNMGRVIPLAAAYNVEMDNLSTGYAILTKNGIATAESTTYLKSMLNELGDTGSAVAGVLQEQTGQSFAQLTESGYSLGDVLTVIGDSVNGDTTAFNNLWGSQEAGIGALALFNAGAAEFNSTLGKMQDSAGATEKAYMTMTNTTEHAQKRMQNAFGNLGITIGSQLNPVISDLYNDVADVVDGFSEFTDEHPGVTAGITAVTTVLGIGAAALTGYTVVTKIATAATKAFSVATKSNAIFTIITGVTAAVGAFKAFTSVMDGNKETVEDYNGTLEQCRSEIDNTRTAYENVCNMYGAESQAAQGLASELETLNAQYQKGGGFAADYAQRLEESKEALASFTTEYNSKMDSIDKDWQNGMVAVAQLEALSKQSELTNADLDMMSQYADYLNDTFNCNIEVDYDTGKLTGFDPTNINSQMAKIAMDNRKQAASESVTGADFTNGYLDGLKELKDFETEYKIVKDEIVKSMNDPGHANMTGYTMSEADEYFGKKIAEAQKVVDGYKNTAFEAFSIMENPDGAEEFLKTIEDTANAYNDLGKSAEEAQKAMTPEEAISEVWAAKEEEINQLAQAYDEAYTAIRTDLDGMFGLFEEASINLENTLSLDGAIDNLESQIDYFNQYEEALSRLSDMGVDNSIIEQLDPEQAVAFAQQLEQLGEIDASQAAAKIEELNGSFGKLSEAKDKVAEKMADVETEFSEKLDDIKKRLGEAVDDMELGKEAADSAKLTMDGYISQLKSSGDTAVSEAQNIARRITAALNVNVSPTISTGSSSSGSTPSVTTTPSSSGSTTATTVKRNANGTTYADDVFIAGDEGPELIIGKKGAKVFPADETNRIIDAVTDDNHFNIPPAESPVKKFENKTESVSRREVDLNINGKGSINVKSNMDKEQVAEILIENLKPALMSIISTELFEEGENSYDF